VGDLLAGGARSLDGCQTDGWYSGTLGSGSKTVETESRRSAFQLDELAPAPPNAFTRHRSRHRTPHHSLLVDLFTVFATITPIPRSYHAQQWKKANTTWPSSQAMSFSIFLPLQLNRTIGAERSSRLPHHTRFVCDAIHRKGSARLRQSILYGTSTGSKRGCPRSLHRRDEAFDLSITPVPHQSHRRVTLSYDPPVL